MSESNLTSEGAGWRGLGRVLVCGVGQLGGSGCFADEGESEVASDAIFVGTMGVDTYTGVADQLETRQV